MLLLLPAIALGAPPSPVAPGPLRLPFEAAADEAGVPVELLYAIAVEASGLRPDHKSAWGGRTMFDFVEIDEAGGPDLEPASALLSLDPNAVIDDWRLAVRAAAALLADRARDQNGGVLPSEAELDDWQGAVAAFSGRDEPMLQGLYVEGIYALLAAGFTAESAYGPVAVAPQDVSVPRAAAPPPDATDYAGAANWVPACADNYSDYSRGGSDIDVIVIHTVQGSYSGCASWFANCSAGASAHYVVRSSDGQVTQMVREADVGWHAGNWDINERSVGIEHEGYVTDCGYYTEAMYQGSAALTLDVASRQGVPLDRSHVIGHNEVPDPYNPGKFGGSGNHTDPGPCWDWDYYMGLLGDGSATTTGKVLGYVRADDIYNTDANLSGATVTVLETGATTVVGDDGLYRFADLPFGTYTVRAGLDGYVSDTCVSELTGAEDWCSIALSPGSDDTGIVADSGTPPGHDDPRRVPRPGTATPFGEMAGCATAGGPRTLALAVGLFLVARRRR